MQTIEPQKHTEFGRVNDQDSGLKDKFDFLKKNSNIKFFLVKYRAGKSFPRPLLDFSINTPPKESKS